MPQQQKIGAAAVRKRIHCLALRTGDAAEAIPGRIENQSNSLGEQVWADPEPGRHRQAEDKAAGRLVDIGFNSRKFGRRKIPLCVLVIAVDGCSRKPAVERIPVTDEKTPLSGTLAGRVRGEETCSL